MRHSVSIVYLHLPLLSKEIYSELFFIKEPVEVVHLAQGCLQVDCGHCGLNSEHISTGRRSPRPSVRASLRVIVHRAPCHPPLLRLCAEFLVLLFRREVICLVQSR